MTSKIKVDNINKVSDDSNIINKCGTTITLGASGDSIALASGASQTGFGRTGTVDWQTGSIKTATFTAANGEGYFCNTAGGTFEMDLPAGVAGAIVSVQDYNNTFDSNSLTVDPNGSEKINGGVAGNSVELNTEGRGVTFVYIDATVGWRSVQDNDFTKKGEVPAFIAATGGTIATCGNFKIHTFTGPGTFCVSCVGNAGGSNKVSYMVVAGGGGGGYEDSGGGGAGGFRESESPTCSYTQSPIASSGGTTVAPGANPITVGAGGAGGTPPTATPSAFGTNGSNSVFGGPVTVTSAGGGGGGGGECNSDNGIRQGKPGGSGGGGAGVFGPQPQDGACGPSGGTGNTPPVSPPQGNTGGNGPTLARQTNNVAELGAGGGGATQVGQKTPSPTTCGAGGAGGAGATTSISGSPVAYAGGGGGGIHTYGGGSGSRSSGGAGGGGGGGFPGPTANESGTNASANSGSGGGGTGGNGGGCAGSGGSGIVIIRYKFQ